MTVVPFAIAGRHGTRPSFNFTSTLSAAAPTAVPPIQIPAVGYIRALVLRVTLAGTGGTSPAFTADGPFNAIQSINFRTAAGSDLIVPMDGYALYLVNKYGGFKSGNTDARVGFGYSATAPSATFTLRMPFEFDAETGLGSIPALAANRSYQLNITWAAISSFLTGAPSVTASMEIHAEYWTEPPAKSASGLSQVTEPQGLGTISQWQADMVPLTPGDKLVKLTNTGAVIRNIVFVLRNSAGARIDANGWPSQAEILLDNNTLFKLPQWYWHDEMRRWFGYQASTKDVANGLDTGVYVMPFHALTGNESGDPANSRSQLLPTLDASLLQIRGDWGSASSTLQIFTNNVVPGPGNTLFSK